MLKFILLYLILTQIAYANSGTFYSLVFGVSGVFWMILYTPVEGVIYKILKVKTPFKVSLKINLFSALIGLVLMMPLAKLGWVESASMVKYLLYKYQAQRPIGFEDNYLTHFKGQFIVIVIYYLSSIFLENYRAKKKFADSGISLKKVIIANTITYLFLVGVWQFTTVMPIKKAVKEFKAEVLKTNNNPSVKNQEK